MTSPASSPLSALGLAVSGLLFGACTSSHHKSLDPDAPHADLEVEIHYAAQPGVLKESVRIDGVPLDGPPGTSAPRHWMRGVRVRPGPVVLGFDAEFEDYKIEKRPVALPPGCNSWAGTAVVPGDCADTPHSPQLVLAGSPRAQCTEQLRLVTSEGELLRVRVSFDARGKCEVSCQSVPSPGQPPRACESKSD